jgi:hypothetical protein
MFRRMFAHGVRAHPALRLLAIALLAVAVAVAVGTNVALILAPAALLALPLLFKRYPGERVIRRLASRIPLTRSNRRVLLPRAPRSLGDRVSALAAPGSGRAPPAAVSI